jgi:hypothetical protein
MGRTGCSSLWGTPAQMYTGKYRRTHGIET